MNWMMLSQHDLQALHVAEPHDDEPPPAHADTLHTQFAAFAAFAMTVIVVAAGFAVLH